MIEHNYFEKVMEFLAKNRRAPGYVGHITISHDKWCGVWQGGTCNCNPELREGMPRPPGD
jgi:hypothetical protein